MTTDNFLPAEYELPKSSDGYMKLEIGENKFRILSKPIIGWEDWKDKKPYRFPMNAKPKAPFDPKQDIKHFWAFIVWNYQKSKIQILEITQKSIQSRISNLAKDEDWGSPFDYDLKVIKSGSGLETEYETVSVPHKKLPEEITHAFKTANINLDALFEGKDPFQVESSVNDMPF